MENNRCSQSHDPLLYGLVFGYEVFGNHFESKQHFASECAGNTHPCDLVCDYQFKLLGELKTQSQMKSDHP